MHLYLKHYPHQSHAGEEEEKVEQKPKTKKKVLRFNDTHSFVNYFQGAEVVQHKLVIDKPRGLHCYFSQLFRFITPAVVQMPGRELGRNQLLQGFCSF